MGLNYEDMFPEGDPPPGFNDPDDDGSEQAHIAAAARALDDPDLPRLIAALDSSLGDLEHGLETAATTLSAAAQDVGRSRRAIRVLTGPSPQKPGARP